MSNDRSPCGNLADAIDPEGCPVWLTDSSRFYGHHWRVLMSTASRLLLPERSCDENRNFDRMIEIQHLRLWSAFSNGLHDPLFKFCKSWIFGYASANQYRIDPFCPQPFAELGQSSVRRSVQYLIAVSGFDHFLANAG
jgi:hypothetical protein